MKLSRYYLIAACAGTALSSIPAYAQVLLPSVELRGGGASSVLEVLPRTANCMGNPGAGLNQVGSNDGSLTTVSAGLFQPASPTATNPVFDCSIREAQPDFQLKYISTGSGTGRTMWRGFQTATSLDGTANKINPFTGSGTPSTWSNIQLAFSDSPISTSDLSTYNSTANNSTNKAGAAIQLPFFVLPVAFAYNPAYGVKTTGAGPVELKFRVKTPVSVNGIVAGGLRLTKDAYCKIFNGEITNWNNALLKTLNGNTDLFDATNDTSTRWLAEGAQIRLVGRADNSGTTDIFTRAIAAQCGGRVAVNKFTRNQQALPYAVGGTIDISRMVPATSYKPSSASSAFAGTVQSLGGLVYDRVSKQICAWDEVNITTRRCDIAVKGTLTNTPTPGLFMVADTSDGVIEAISGLGSNSLIASTTPGISLNGAFGYNSADGVKPSPGRTLFSAALAKGTSTTSFVMPSATNAALAFGTILPPQSTATSGAYNVADTRTLGAVDPYQAITATVNGGSSVPVDRANPLHWAAVLNNPNLPTAGSLADPTNGYPVTGPAYLMTYTCFKPANPLVPGNNAKRFGIVNYMLLAFGKQTKDFANAPISANTLKGTGATSLGVISQSNITVPPASWINAIIETFLKKSTQTSGDVQLGNRNLWIQDGNPTTALDVDGIVQATDQKSNPTCDANFGA
jgi:hypothetical protein